MQYKINSIDEAKIILNRRWLELIDSIDGYQKQCKKVILIAVSRRMPRILRWLKQSADSRQRDILDHCIITTEIALPFLSLESSINYKVIIVDDVVISGKTLQSIFTLTSNFLFETPAVHVFFTLRSRNRIPFEVKYHSITESYLYEKSEAQYIFDLISGIILRNLPIDLAFPIISVSTADNRFDLESEFNRPDSIIQEDSYEVDIRIDDKSDIDIHSRTILLKKELNGNLNNDFAKIRIYSKPGYYIFVPYAPNVISTDELLDPELFENPIYGKIWELVHEYVPSKENFFGVTALPELMRIRILKSLANIANYLYSLSSFMRFWSDSGCDKSIDLIFDASDLDLIFGPDLSRDVLFRLNMIKHHSATSPRMHRRVNLQSIFVPSHLLSSYTLKKYIQLIESDFKNPLETIFKTADIFSGNNKAGYNEFDFEVEGVMESYESLEFSMQGDSSDDNIPLSLNKWIDTNIDKGLIVARYANVCDETGREYWRRFFRASSFAQSCR